MDFGDSRAAVAAGLESHLVAAYSDELDGVATALPSDASDSS
jgi:hypothetical protein